jgi:hypothetical protein
MHTHPFQPLCPGGRQPGGQAGDARRLRQRGFLETTTVHSGKGDTFLLLAFSLGVPVSQSSTRRPAGVMCQRLGCECVVFERPRQVATWTRDVVHAPHAKEHNSSSGKWGIWMNVVVPHQQPPRRNSLMSRDSTIKPICMRPHGHVPKYIPSFPHGPSLDPTGVLIAGTIRHASPKRRCWQQQKTANT